MNSTKAVEFYHSLLRFGVQPGLERIKALLNRLGDPQKDLPCVHVAGTNGKGTTCTLVASALTAAGYKTGLYTSPYVIDFRERIRLCGQMISERDLEEVTERVKIEVAYLNGQGIYPTEFEAITAAAFLYFKQKNCEIAVLEVGLGGKYDATNVIKEPLVSILTSISLDHVGILGDTVEKIAREKSGIIKPGCSVITSQNQPPEALMVIRQAAGENRSPLCIINENTEFTVTRESISGTEVLYRDAPLLIPFAGAHQLENASLSVAALRVLQNKGFAVSNNELYKGFANAMIPARIEMISKTPTVILDGSHNQGSTAALAGVLKRFLPNKKILCVIGMMADKDIDTALNNILPFVTDCIAVTPSNPRAIKSERLKELIEQKGVFARAVDDPVQGVKLAADLIKDYQVLLVCGSLYLAGDVRAVLKNQFT